MAITATRDKLRLEIGDTDSTNFLFNNDELDYFLSAEADNLAKSALHAVEAGLRKLARMYDVTADGQSLSRSQMAEMFIGEAKRLRALGIVTAMDASVGIFSDSTLKIDSYSNDIPFDQTSAAGGTAVSTPRQNYYVVGSPDVLP